MYKGLIHFLLAVSLLLASCRSASVFTKRKYTGGHYFAFAKKADSPSPITAKPWCTSVPTHATVEFKIAKEVKGPAQTIAARSGLMASAEKGTVSERKIFTGKLKPAPELKVVVKRDRHSKAASLDGGTVALGLVGFVLFTIIYFISILMQVPGIHPIAALLVAMLFAAITVVTGVYMM